MPSCYLSNMESYSMILCCTINKSSCLSFVWGAGMIYLYLHMEHLHDIIMAYAIWWLGWVVRYLSSALIEEKTILIKEIILRLIVAGWFWVFIFWIATSLQDKYWYGQMIVYWLIYLGGMLSPQLIKVMVVKIPDLFSKKLDQVWGNW